MSSLVFLRPANGAVRDVKELEYISALHQCINGVNSDGTVEAGGIRAMLLSRHGVSITEEHIETAIINDLAGDPRGSLLTEKNLDIPQLASLIMLPTLAKIASSSSSKQDGVTDESEQEQVFGQVLRLLLQTCRTDDDNDDNSSTDETFLTKEKLKQMFAAYGEDEVCEFGIEKMIEHVAGDDYDPNSDGVILNKESFIRALTSDLGAYDFAWETTKSTHFSDFLTLVDGGIEEMEKVTKERKSGKKETPNNVVSSEDEEAPKTSLLKPRLDHMTLVPNAPQIDLTIDSFKSQTFFVTLFISLIVSYLAYFSGEGVSAKNIQCNGNFGCDVGVSIANWLSLVLLLGIGGCVYVVVASAGNGAVKDCGIPASLFGIGIVYLMTIHPFFFDIWNIAKRTENEALVWAPYTSVAVGMLIILQQVLSLVQYFLHDRVDFGVLNRKSIILQKELHTKKSAAYKANGILNHALQLHENPSLSPSIADLSSQPKRFQNAQHTALLKFEERLNDTETVGGIWWTWTRLKSLCEKDGIWLGARLIASQNGQIIGLLGFCFLLGFFLSAIHNELAEQQASSFTGTLELEGGVRSMYYNESGVFLYSASEVDDTFLSSNNLVFGYNFEEDIGLYLETTKERITRRVIGALAFGREAGALLSIDVTEDLISRVANAIESITGITLDRAIEYVDAFAAYQGGMVSFAYEEAKKNVEEGEAKSAVIFGWVCAMIALLSILLSFIPRYISQTLMYRSGVGMSPLTDPRFAQLKEDPWAVNALFGTTFWGLMIAGICVWSVCGGAFFLIVWSVTSDYALGFISLWIGLFVSWVLKKVVLTLCKKRAYLGLFRIDPGFSNVINVVMETWNIGITFGFVTARAAKMILMSCVYIGRLDTNFVAPHVNCFGAGIDEDYQAFHADLLLHESHRHPYLERLSLLYLMKVHEGPTFAKRQGSCWRLLFVLALMPWLRRYRSKQMRLTDADRKQLELVDSKEQRKVLEVRNSAISDSETWEDNRG